jgi:predicted GIY-YIG superfamily endonuclease
MQTQIVYLLHFTDSAGNTARYRHAGHYIGSAKYLDARIAHHRDGSGANLTRVIRAAGLTFTVAATWRGGRDKERQLKSRGGASRICPVCKGRPVCDAPLPVLPA